MVMIGAGTMSGVFLERFVSEYVLPLLRVRRASGVPMTKMNRTQAISLDRCLSEWSALLPGSQQSQYGERLRESLPETVQKAWNKHIRTDDAPITVHINNPARTWEFWCERNARLKEHVRNFYQEPTVQAYLRV